MTASLGAGKGARSAGSNGYRWGYYSGVDFVRGQPRRPRGLLGKADLVRWQAAERARDHVFVQIAP